MAHPVQNYIKFSILKNWPEETVESVNLMLSGCGFPEVSRDEFEVLLSSLDPPPGFAPNSKTHKPTIEFMKTAQVYSMWSSKPEAMDAVALVELPQVRETIQLLLMGRFAPDEISTRIQAKYGKTVPPKSVAAYRHYFWCTDIVGIREIRSLFKADPLRDSYIATIWGSKNQALFRAGFSPSIDGKRALKEAHRSLAMRVEATRLMPDNGETARILTSLTKELVNVHSALHGEGAGVEDMMKELQRFVMERNAGNVVSIHQLAPKGNYSQGGEK